MLRVNFTQTTPILFGCFSTRIVSVERFAHSSTFPQGSAIISPRSRTVGFDLLEDRNQPVVDVTADITANTTWLSGETYRLTGTRSVRNGAMLTIQAGAIVSASNSFFTLQVANDTSGAGVTADGVTFNAQLSIARSAQGQIQNSTFNSSPTFDFPAGIR